MVRLKDRYLLVNILYPEAPKGESKDLVSDLVLYNQPTPADFKDYALANAIRAQVRMSFGDYGAGAVERSLQSRSHVSCSMRIAPVANRLPFRSQVLLAGDIYLHRTRVACAPPPRLGRPDLYGPSPWQKWPIVHISRGAR